VNRSLTVLLFSITGPYILRIIFLSNILNAFSSVTVKVYVSAPYVATGLVNVLYTCSLAALDIILLLSVLRQCFPKRGVRTTDGA
jgi:hypothetical protein